MEKRRSSKTGRELALVGKAKPKGASKVTNGTSIFLRKIDGRTLKARRIRDLYFQWIEDLGGFDAVGESVRQLAKMAAHLTADREELDAHLLLGKKLKPGVYKALCQELRDTIRLLGVENKNAPKVIEVPGTGFDGPDIIIHFVRPGDLDPVTGEPTNVPDYDEPPPVPDIDDPEPEIGPHNGYRGPVEAEIIPPDNVTRINSFRRPVNDDDEEFTA